MSGSAGFTATGRGERMRCAIVIAGPTAGGKSRLGLALAERFGGTIINADSMQLYRDLEILTARPSADEMRRVPHRLFGTCDAAFRASVGWWHTEAAREIRQAWREGRLPILIGGSGLYLGSLFEGLAEIPAIPASIRRSVRTRLEEKGPHALHAELVRRDPSWAGRTSPGDRQRVARGLEVLEATGRRLSEFLDDRVPGALERELADGRVLRLVLAPPRELLHRRIAERFEWMMAHGALDEVRRLLERGLPSELPAMKAIGVPPLAAHLRGEIGIDAACSLVKRDTRRYAKRQMTWARHRFADWHWPDWPEDMEADCVLDRLMVEISQRLAATMQASLVADEGDSKMKEHGR